MSETDLVNAIRVFPRRTALTPDDDRAVVGYPNLFHQADRVLISVAFTYDIPAAERLAKAWEGVAPVEMGGPAFNHPGGEFVPGMFLKQGAVITSRGCPNHCWFCSVWRREGQHIRELPIRDGWNVLDDNLLACSEAHIRGVFAMLARQKHRPRFTGGLEAARLKPWHVDLLTQAKPERMYFAYDEPADYEPLRSASRLLFAPGAFTPASHVVSAYCLIGYPRDTHEAAEHRLRQLLDLGITPMAMLWRDQQGQTSQEWRRFQRMWARPTLIYRGAS